MGFYLLVCVPLIVFYLLKGVDFGSESAPYLKCNEISKSKHVFAKNYAFVWLLRVMSLKYGANITMFFMCFYGVSVFLFHLCCEVSKFFVIFRHFSKNSKKSKNGFIVTSF